MTKNWLSRSGRAGARMAAGAAMVLALGSCGMEDLEIPDFEGPSTYGLGVRLTASPDIVTADGFSTSLVVGTLSDENGRPLAGREIFFSVSDVGGTFADIGQLRSTGPDRGLGTGLVVRTDGGGAARVAYVAPPRSDMTANNVIIVAARVVGTDSRGQTYKSVEIELRSAEPRLFPPNPINCPAGAGPGVQGCPRATFIVEPAAGPYRVNQTVLFQTTARDSADANDRVGTIVRYEWFFGDGTKEDKPDTNHIWRQPGIFTVTHVVTDDQGAQAAASAVITVIP